jgi:hypothetical protein
MESLEFKVFSISEARAELDGHQKRHAEIARGPAESRPESALLLDTTIRWMAGLPADVRPFGLAQQFPRIANAIAQLWPRVARCTEYLDSLVLDDRGGRKGFDYGIAQELTRLHGYYADLHPVARSTPDAIQRAR